ncbi:fringe glycosyltransferase [Galendromus occidentalis]|uniref:Fringe glycosyltransferase n=1 Tax=Galendromus occidentalis TaxID=34638 RepID=A0AAJ6QM73_9ACAR|nr:fringe glycosyltransferase [Galendromus occidentalis]
MVLCFWLSLMLWAPYGILEARPALSDVHSSTDLLENVARRSRGESSPKPKSADLPESDKVDARIKRRNSLLHQISNVKASIDDPDNASVTTSKKTNVLGNVFISVKTTRQNHRVRLPAILQTWFQLAREQTYFFTDAEDAEVSRASGGHLVMTGCASGHTRQALSCKMNSEFDAFVLSAKEWWCHFDDDNYVNVVSLEKTLKSFNSSELWYLGRDSIRPTIDLTTKQWGDVRFRFATGGAGFCISRALANEMKPHAFKGRLRELSEEIRLPDDVTVGFLVEVIVGAKLTALPNFHSHLEEMLLIRKPLRNQISLSYNSKRKNFVPVEQLLPRDPTRFLSIHCEIFRELPTCKRFRRRR